MKVAYVFKTSMASTFQLSTMILPQLENNNHMVDVLGMFFFDDNIFCLKQNDQSIESYGYLLFLYRCKTTTLLAVEKYQLRLGLSASSVMVRWISKRGACVVRNASRWNVWEGI